MMELKALRGVGPKRLEALHAAGIHSLRDLLFTVPYQYRDLGTIVHISDAQQGQPQTLHLHKCGTPKVFYHGRLCRITCAFKDDTGTIIGCWFNQPWMRQVLESKEDVLLHGKIDHLKNSLHIVNPSLEDSIRIIPVYRAIEGIPNKTRETLIAQALDYADTACAEALPDALLGAYSLMSSPKAIRILHQPDSMEQIALAQRRIAFEQLLLYQIAVRKLRRRRHAGQALPIVQGAEQTFWSTLPFSPTNAQKRTLTEILNDLRKPSAMARMVQGDVGCGKTAIAFGAMTLCAKGGYQSAFMAPTELLARQHFESAKNLLEPHGIRCGLLLSGMQAAKRREALNAIQSGAYQVVIGTHALISESVQYQNLALCITDEQHRFGVSQRTRLLQKGNHGIVPHLLVMSATPIPRSLALMLYGDLDVSVVDELPPGRMPVKTRVVPPAKRSEMYRYLKAEVQQGSQAYIVCPLIEENEGGAQYQAVESLYATLSKGVLKDQSVGITHGRQTSAEKADVLEKFSSGSISVLIATTVIEVGMNVPNATIMIVEDAERFGLAQLHQLRGRVGRGLKESQCFLVGSENERLRALTMTNDGFALARKDLELRGPGELLGTRQHGDFTVAGGFDLMNAQLLHDAVECAQILCDSDEMHSVYKQYETLAAAMLHDTLSKVSVS